MLTKEQRERYRATERARVKKRVEDGICTRCGKPAAPGKTKCLDCLDYEAVAQMKYFYNLPKEEMERQVERRRKRSKERYYERKAAGLCVRCGKKIDSGVVCLVCRAKDRERRRERKCRE